MNGQATSTTHYWFTVFHHPQIAALRSLLERLPSKRRHELIDSWCRTFPSVKDRTFCHDPKVVGKIMEFVRKQTGLSFMSGASDATRAQVAATIGHAVSLQHPPKAGVAGILQCLPDRVVPVPGVRSIDPGVGAKQTRKQILEFLPSLLAGSAPLLILDGVWGDFPTMRPDILRTANRRHVLLLEVGLPDFGSLKGQTSELVQSLVLSTRKKPPGAIFARVETLIGPKPL